MNSIRIAALVGVPVLALTGVLVAAPTANAATGVTPTSIMVGKFTLNEVTDLITGDQSGDEEFLEADAAAGGVDLGLGTATVEGTGGNQSVHIPLHSLGTVRDGEQVIVTTSDIETGPGGLSIVEGAATLTCHLDANGNGTCS
ncbi:hypothetical protein ACFWNL_38820 [Kitasatospora sp. NPDC058397]|uniref:hypothetical protein n=1 Tax=unclassified Kitasatospora TaxID=2633591 RepID=UPI0036534CFC